MTASKLDLSFLAVLSNLSPLKDSQCAVSSFLKAQKLSLLFSLCGLKFFEEVVRLFYANLCISSDNGEAEILIMGNHIIINELLFEDVFGTKFSSVIPYMNETWPDDFAVSLEAITLIPRKGSLSSISTRDVFVLYCLLKKYRINWEVWFKEYMLESVEDPNASANLPYGLLVSRILVNHLVDLSMFTHVVINATYDSRTFSSMGYAQVENKWVKKDSVKARVEGVKPIKISADSAALLMQDNDELKTRILEVEHGLETLHDAVEMVFRLQKDTSSDVGKLHIAMIGIKHEGISTVNKLIQQAGSLKSGVSSSNNELVVSVQTSYSSISKSVERSYNFYCVKIINTHT
ncbi:hypothetical protein H5410_037159 [Solanum commersonii]|uniref:Uncharacterized protein n=1 Tax=Solanum commersonii TaxID=4109 RepID=A0A9J5Y7P3_SOLCO|nr:hypothetical protein H5410_037159 [Solanum commersonii]